MATKHSCSPDQPGMPLPFGRKAPRGECARCDELYAGAAPRPSWASKQDEDAVRAREIHAHFQSDKHRRECAGVCTFGDW